MPLRFSEVAALQNAYSPQFRSQGGPQLMPQILQQRFQAAENEKARKARAEELGTELGAKTQMRMAELEAEQQKEHRKGTTQYMRELGEVARLGDEGQLAAKLMEAQQHGLKYEVAEQAPAQVSSRASLSRPMVGGMLAEQPVKEGVRPGRKVFRVTDPQTGITEEIDLTAIQERNRAATTDATTAYMQLSRPQDLEAIGANLEMARALNLPPDVANKVMGLSTANERLNRESAEGRAQLGADVARDNAAASRAMQGAHHADNVGIRYAQLGLQKEKQEDIAGARDAAQQNKWASEAKAMARDLKIVGKREAIEDAGKVLALLESEPLIPGATPSKSQIVAIGEFAKLAQAGDPRLSDADRRAAADSWSIVQRVAGALTRGAYGELHEQDVKDFEEALTRIINVGDTRLQGAFADMATAKMGLPPEGQAEYDRHLNAYFGRQRWFKEYAQKHGIQIGGGAPVSDTPADTQPSAPAVDPDVLNLLEEEGL